MASAADPAAVDTEAGGRIICARRVTVCERCCCVDSGGREGVAVRDDVTVNGRPGARLCDFCYGRITGTIADPMEGLA